MGWSPLDCCSQYSPLLCLQRCTAAVPAMYYRQALFAIPDTVEWIVVADAQASGCLRVTVELVNRRDSVMRAVKLINAALQDIGEWVSVKEIGPACPCRRKELGVGCSTDVHLCEPNKKIGETIRAVKCNRTVCNDGNMPADALSYWYSVGNSGGYCD